MLRGNRAHAADAALPCRGPETVGWERLVLQEAGRLDVRAGSEVGGCAHQAPGAGLGGEGQLERAGASGLHQDMCIAGIGPLAPDGGDGEGLSGPEEGSRPQAAVPADACLDEHRFVHGC